MAMENKIQIEVVTKNLKNAVNEFNKLNSTLKGTNQQIQGLRIGNTSNSLKTISKEGNKILRTTQTFAKDGSLKTISTNISTASNGFNSLLKSITKIGLTIGVIKQLGSSMTKFVQNSIDYSESLNLFNVVFDNVYKNGTTTYSKLGKQAMDFQNKLKTNFGANPTESLTYQALFQSMATSQGLSDTAAYIMSENSTKLVYDLSSLFNKEQEDVAEALRAGIYAGQTKPLRTYGIDITETSLQATLEEMQKTNRELEGLTVANMSQAEKQMLRYLTVLKQTTNAQGDFANTIESPANLLKTLENNLTRMATALGNLFVGPFQKLLQYANAIVIVITEVANAFASIFGIKISDYNTGIASLPNEFEDQEEAINGASKAAAKYKRQLLSFDEIHNISEPTNNDSGNNVSGGISQALLDSLKGYENGLDSVKLKAQEIAENIMKWLGFTKETNIFTGETYWNYEGLKTTISNMYSSFVKLKPIAKVVVAYLTGLVAVKTINGFTSLVKLFGSSGLLGGVKNLLSPLKSLTSTLNGINFSLFDSTLEGISTGIDVWAKDLSNLDHLKVSLVGAGGLLASFQLIDDGMKELSKDTDSLKGKLEALGGVVGSTFSGALLGAQFGSTGAVIGGVAGAVISLYDAYMKLPNSMLISTESITKITEETNKYIDSLNAQKAAIEEQLTVNLAVTSVHTSLLKELELIVDKNGEVKKGYEERAQYIIKELSEAYGIEIEYSNGIIKNYEEQVQKIKDVIKAEEARILLEANKEAYANAISAETELFDKRESAIKANEEAQAKLVEAEKQHEEVMKKIEKEAYAGTGSVLRHMKMLSDADEAYEKVKKAAEEAAEAEKRAVESYKENTLTIDRYSNLKTSIITGNYEKIEEAAEQYKNSYIDNGNLIIKTDEDNTKKQIENFKILINAYKNTNKKRYEELVGELKLETQAVENLTEEQAGKWAALAEADGNAYMNAIKDLNENVQEQLSKMEPTINLKADATSASMTIQDFLKSISGKISGLDIDKLNIPTLAKSTIKKALSSVGIAYATGGFPEEGPFYMNRGEIAGKFSNGKGVVANNYQITEGIKQAVMAGMSTALASTGNRDVNLNITMEEGIVVKKAINGINEITRTTGESPLYM